MRSIFLSVLAVLTLFSVQSFGLAPCSDMILERFTTAEVRDFPPDSAYGRTENFYAKAIHLTMIEITGNKELSPREAYELFKSKRWNKGLVPLTIWHDVGSDSGLIESLIELRVEFKGKSYRSLILHRVNLRRYDSKQWILCMDKMRPSSRFQASR